MSLLMDMQMMTSKLKRKTVIMNTVMKMKHDSSDGISSEDGYNYDNVKANDNTNTDTNVKKTEYHASGQE